MSEQSQIEQKIKEALEEVWDCYSLAKLKPDEATKIFDEIAHRKANELWVDDKMLWREFAPKRKTGSEEMRLGNVEGYKGAVYLRDRLFNAKSEGQ